MIETKEFTILVVDDDQYIIYFFLTKIGRVIWKISKRIS